MFTDADQLTDANDGTDIELGMIHQDEEHEGVTTTMAPQTPLPRFYVASNIGNLIFAKENRANVTLAILLSGANTGVTFLAPWLLGKIVQMMNDGENTTMLLGRSCSLKEVIGLLVAAYMLNQQIPNLISLLLAAPTVNNAKKLLMDCMDHQLKKSLNFYLTEPTGKHTNLIQKGFGFGAFGLPMLTQLTPTLIQLIFADAYFFQQYGGEMGGSIIALVLAELVYTLLTAPQVMKNNAEQLETGNKVNETLTEMIQCYKTMRDFCKYEETVKSFEHVLSNWAPTYRKSLSIQAQANMGQTLIAYAHMFWVAWYVGTRVQSGQYQVSDFIVLIGYLQLLSALLPAFSQAVLMFVALLPDAAFVFRSLHEADEVIDSHPDISFPEIDEIGPSIEFDQVTFYYPPRPNEHERKVAFSNLSFQIMPGERFAIVTESGVGKTTLFNLLYGYYLPSSGTIKINGRDITQMSLEALQRNITIFEQSPNFLKGSIRDNICYGAEHSEDVTDEIIWELARSTHLDEFLNGFKQSFDACGLIKMRHEPFAPHGAGDLLTGEFGVIYACNKLFFVQRLINDEQEVKEIKATPRMQDEFYTLKARFDHVVINDARPATPDELELIIPVAGRGPLDTDVGENGKTLSGGQKQKIAMLRGLLKNGSIWLLDEPTASLDASVANDMLTTLRSASRGTTSLISNHNLIQLREYADKIIVIDNKGNIVGQGTHQELIDTCTPYNRLYRECIEREKPRELTVSVSRHSIFTLLARENRHQNEAQQITSTTASPRAIMNPVTKDLF
jgi:ABC-type multidrug transport system fused ATPase/permease subunit